MLCYNGTSKSITISQPVIEKEKFIGSKETRNFESGKQDVNNIAPKSTASGKKTLDVAANIAVCVLNYGPYSISKIMEQLDIEDIEGAH